MTKVDDPAIRALLAGYRSYKALFYDKRGDLTRRLASEGQQPNVLVIACSDSRADPAMLFNADPGEIFVVRNVAALVPPYEPDDGFHGVSAAIEFAVRDLMVSHIMVLGHSRCGGIAALNEMVHGEPQEREFIGPWVNVAREACALHGADLNEDTTSIELASIKNSIKNLKGFPWLMDRMNAGDLSLHGWWFDLDEGALHAHDAKTGQFSPI